MALSAALRRTRLFACLQILCTLCALVALPTAALARSPRGGSSGGGGLGTSTTTSSSTTTTPTTTGPGTGTAPPVVKLGGVLYASGDGITFTVAASGTLGQPLTITGNAPSSNAGELLEIESAKPGQTTWTPVASTTITSTGSFSARWTPASNGQLALRAVIAPGTSSTGTTSTGTTTTSSGGAAGISSPSGSAAAGELSTSALTIPIFKDAVATLYGPGLWGHHTACGERLTRATIGVASRTLKCGTQVSVVYKGREITVPVIDRGPFTTGVTWDLTMATAKALGIRETATIGTLTSAGTSAIAARS